jgi:signal transduction histidine kinase
MGGDIELASSVGQGTTVRVSLPGERADPDD